MLAITRHRAETLKARPYDGDLARIIVPRDGGLGWLRAMADPADDLRHPMKGPFHCARDGTAEPAPGRDCAGENSAAIASGIGAGKPARRADCGQ